MTQRVPQQLLTLRPRERRLALVAAALIGCWAVVGWVVQPLWRRLQELGAQVAVKTEKLEAMNRLLSQAPSVEQTYAALGPYLEAQEDEPAQAALLEELESLSRSAGIQMNLKPRPARHEERVHRFEVEVDVEGAQQELLTFLDGLLRLPQLVVIDRLRIATAPGKEGFLHANLSVQKLVIR